MPVSFGQRLALAWRILTDSGFAERVTHTPRPPLPEGRGGESQATKKEAAEKHDGDRALALLSMLQREGRLVDFLEQDVAGFSDEEIGAAVRVVHEGCRKALRSAMKIDAIRSEEEGARVEIEKGYDASLVKLTGDVRGEGPFEGVLKHKGWRAKDVKLPEPTQGHDASVIAPAEVEL